MLLKSKAKTPMLITGAVLLFVFLLLGSFHLTDFSRYFIKPVFRVAPDAAYTPAQAVVAISKRGEQIKDGFFNAGFTKEVWWVSVTADVLDDSWIQVANPHINDIRIYEQKEGVWEEVYQSGDYYLYEQRILDDPDYWYPVKRVYMIT